MGHGTLRLGVCVALYSSLVLGLAGCGKAEKNLKPEITIDLGDGLTMEFVLVHSGSFMMGTTSSSDNIGLAAQPQHKVEISRPFYLGKYEVTCEQWQSVMGNNPSRYRDIVGHPLSAPENAAKCPVECVSWNDCQAFLDKLKAKAPGMELCLPTEAQWEYACRAGSTGEYCYGDGDANLGDYAWYEGNSDGRPHPVGLKKPNAWGLFDMHGNGGNGAPTGMARRMITTPIVRLEILKVRPPGEAGGTEADLTCSVLHGHALIAASLVPRLTRTTLILVCGFA